MKNNKKYQVFVTKAFVNEICDLLFIDSGYRDCVQNIETIGFDGEFFITRHSKKYYIKLGKALKLVFPYLNESEISDTVNKYRKKTKGDYYDDIVVTRDIDEVYNLYHYSSGTIGSSCMRGKGHYYDDLQRTETISIAYIINDEEEVLGRALLWEAKDLHGESYKLMDRVYYHNEQSLRSLLQWGRDNGYCVKEEQNFSNSNFVTPDGMILDKAFKVMLDSSLDEAPYMDTFKYYGFKDYDENTPCLYTREIKGKDLLLLDSTDGTVNNNSNLVCCDHCNDSFNSANEGAYIPNTGYVCDDCLYEYYYYTVDTSEYVYHDDVYITRNGDAYASNKNLIYCDDIAEYVHQNDDWAYIEDLCEYWYNYEDAYYHEDDCCYYSYPEQIKEDETNV